MALQIQVVSSAAAGYKINSKINAGAVKKRIDLLSLHHDRVRLVAAQSNFFTTIPKESCGRKILYCLGLRKWVRLQVEQNGVRGYVRVNMRSLSKRYGLSFLKLFFKAWFSKNGDVTNFVKGKLPPLVKQSSTDFQLWKQNEENAKKLITNFVKDAVTVFAEYKQKSEQQLLALANKNDGYAMLTLEVKKRSNEGPEAFYERTAAQGCALAEFFLAIMYYHGEGAKQDIQRARLYFTRAEMHANNDPKLRSVAQLKLALGDQFLPGP